MKQSAAPSALCATIPILFMRRIALNWSLPDDSAVEYHSGTSLTFSYHSACLENTLMSG